MTFNILIFIKRFLLVAIFAVGLSSISGAIDVNHAFDQIDQDFEAGHITKAEKLVGQMSLFFDRSAVLSANKSELTSMLKSGTPLIREVYENWELFSTDEQSLMTAYLSRPSLETTYDSPGGFFKIHFDTALNSPEMVPPEDKDSNLIPDYVDRIAQYCDSSYQYYVVGKGYLPPPVDAQGGDSLYDIYLMAIPAYGATFPDAPGDSVWDDYSSFIGIHHNFYGFAPNDDPEGDTIGSQKVTCAHEYFHAVQLAYDRYEALWWMEASATWMEEVLFPEVNDNYNYLPYYFNFPEIGLQNISENFHLYGAFVWPAYLNQKYNSQILKDIWSACRYNSAIDAFDSSLILHGTSMQNIFPEFTLWNYYTGSRAMPGQYYESAADYPMVAIDQSFSEVTHDSIHPIKPPDALACNYIKMSPTINEWGHSELLLDGSNLVRWGLVTIFSQAGDDSSHVIVSNGLQDILLYQSRLDMFDYVVAVPSVITPFLDDLDYRFDSDLIPYGDANFDRVTNVGDAIYLINLVFKGGPVAIPIWQTGNANCDAVVNVADAVTIINFVFNNGAEPCSGE